MHLTEDQITQFRADGFLVLERLIDADTVAGCAARFEPMFRGEFETGLYPDEWNWRAGRDADDVTRQICNGWKSDGAIAGVVLSAEIGRICAELAGWPGARIGQDNVLWKPPGARSLGFHQDNSYCDWVVPMGYMTCWITLDPVTAASGTLEYVRGSHRWSVSPPVRQFHAPDDYREAMRDAAREAGIEPEIVPVEVPAGGGAFHAGGTWHGSGWNRSRDPRRSVVSHCISSDACFHPDNISYIYSRYRRVGDDAMDESFFPILWTRDGYRTPFLADYLPRPPDAV